MINSFLSTSNQYSQGSLITITVNTLDSLGNPTPPDDLITPNASVDFQTPNGPINIFENRLMTSINTTFYYINIDSTLLSVGSYNATLSWIVAGQQMTSVVRFDVLAFDGSVLSPIDPISRLRLRLGDMNFDPTRWIWSDQELSDFLNSSLENFNSAPPRSSFFWFNIPLIYMNAIFLYAEYLALNKQAIKIASQAVSFNDRNVSVNKPAQAALYSNLAEQMFVKADAERLRIKRQYAYGTGYIVQAGAQGFMSNIPLRAAGRFWSF